ncbi:MAG TPA: isoprenylcysteine carboxylmethyltransferase family protein, partial [Thermoanaerobaculia bacterium]|nr:isoprenylcysteine carboxylmethyltransferase family protein [Thermoanaerobaculia bacterium]
MKNPELLLYVVHVLFWASFGVTRAIVSRGTQPTAEAAVATQEETAPYSRALLVLHMIGFGVLYFGIGATVIPRLVPHWFAGQRIAGTLVIALGAFVMSSALLFFRSWRFRAKLDEGHQLATGGPFRFVRHPIYTGLDLLALGSAIWDPSPFLWIAFALIAIGSDLRARSEEKLLERAFG